MSGALSPQSHNDTGLTRNKSELWVIKTRQLAPVIALALVIEAYILTRKYLNTFLLFAPSIYEDVTGSTCSFSLVYTATVAQADLPQA